MKDRPITAEEFVRMIEKVDSISSKTPDEWKFLLQGLWWSGLRIGEAAGVKVSEAKTGKVKYASVHDLRRTFGFRWSRLVMPTELKEFMRHENISTTMQFYVGQDDRATMKRLREAVANTLANTTTSEAKTGNDSATETVTR